MNQKDAINLLSLIGGLLATIVILAAFNAYVIITPGQAGVLSVLGKAKDGVLLEGLHFKPPFVSSVDIYDVTVQKFEVPAQSSTKDLQDLSASFAINFRLDPTQVVAIRRTQGTLQNIVAKIIAPQTQESFKIAAAKRTVEEAITRRSELKEDFDNALSTRLEKYGILVLDTSVVDLNFSPEFARAVEDKQIAEQRAQRAVYITQEAEQQAQAEVNRAKGKAEAQRLLAETLKEQGGGLVLQKEAIEAWREGGAQMPRVLVMDGAGKNSVPFLFNYSDSFPENTP
ncbi:MAG: prohibitin family protein [Microcystis wesenbergii TW10]|uniref:Prohibitin n=5 Tax=Microcystis TaxID=1125 RepID=A0A0A1VXJ7_MICAE|nr:MULTISPECIES: prohibitin family protein [Microcystis]REJ47198.1 MAG: prohibitin family protein [Microcystis wesenbergii TW10]TRT86178.1 MAG: prohibitin family protein [Microcystis aeruginosa Ma_OC_H_19870700_S124]TRU87019.1 MAG: prohibitin family protein [Microcystis novacekii Mn_MB_F_20050700_S1D]TRU87666.1 MAG: prohibitin family protein [Microcystis novacekii Mn_MB_F_20050700_S1]MCZ8040443.1 prohibitin family protein [Microcystis sp. LE17-20A]